MKALHFGWEVFQVRNWLLPIACLMGCKKSVEIDAEASPPWLQQLLTLFSTLLSDVQFPSLSLMFSGWESASPGGEEGCSFYSTQSCHFMRVLSRTKNLTHTISFILSSSIRRVLLLAPLSGGGNWGSEKLSGLAEGHPANKDGTSPPTHPCLLLIGCTLETIVPVDIEKRLEGEQFIVLSSIPATPKGVGSDGASISRPVLGPRSRQEEDRHGKLSWEPQNQQLIWDVPRFA